MRRKRRGWLWLAVLILAAVGLYLGNNIVTVSRYTVLSDKLPQGFACRIVQLSDLHCKRFGSDNAQLKQSVANEQPDIVVITGDIINSQDSDYGASLELCEWLAGEYPTYFVVGNHELDRPYAEYMDFLDKLAATGVQLIDNRTIDLSGDGSVRLHGLYTGDWHCYAKDEDAYNAEMQPDILNELLGKADTGAYNIVITHSPDYFPREAAWGADLVFSGHIHGGMIRLPFFGGLLSPGFSFFPQYDAGEYEIGGSKMIVSRGLGNSVGVRVFNPPELVSVTLERG